MDSKVEFENFVVKINVILYVSVMNYIGFCERENGMLLINIFVVEICVD